METQHPGYSVSLRRCLHFVLGFLIARTLSGKDLLFLPPCVRVPRTSFASHCCCSHFPGSTWLLSLEEFLFDRGSRIKKFLDAVASKKHPFLFPFAAKKSYLEGYVQRRRTSFFPSFSPWKTPLLKEFPQARTISQCFGPSQACRRCVRDTILVSPFFRRLP